MLRIPHFVGNMKVEENTSCPKQAKINEWANIFIQKLLLN